VDESIRNLQEVRERLPKELEEFTESLLQKEIAITDGNMDPGRGEAPQGETTKIHKRRSTGSEETTGRIVKAGNVRESRSDSAVGTLFVPKSDGTK
jgi:hypothetical protein